MARPTKYKPEHDEQVYKFKLDGKSDAYISDFFKFSRSTLSLWKAKHKSFSDNYKKGLADYEADNVHDVKNALLQRAKGMTVTDVESTVFGDDESKKRVKTTVRHILPDVTACAVYLNNKAPDEFKPRKAADDEGDNGKGRPVIINFIDSVKDDDA